MSLPVLSLRLIVECVIHIGLNPIQRFLLPHLISGHLFVGSFQARGIVSLMLGQMLHESLYLPDFVFRKAAQSIEERLLIDFASVRHTKYLITYCD